MGKTNLESGVDWADLRYNPVQGLCPNTDCSIYADCYMKRPPFCWSVNKNPELRLNEKKLMVKLPDEPKRIFVQDNLELFHEKIPGVWINRILLQTRVYPQHTFIFLTKNPTRYAEFDFPKNCWLGVTVTGGRDNWRIKYIEDLKPSTRTIFVSYEPLLDQSAYVSLLADWIIVGALTGPKAKEHQAQKIWVERIVGIGREKGIPVFLKNNLEEVWGKDLIQEYPEGRNP